MAGMDVGAADILGPPGRPTFAGAGRLEAAAAG
jgi:hypothetical protein